MYEQWHYVVCDLRVTSSTFEQIRNWCLEHIGPLKEMRPYHIWDWGTNAGYSTWFVFKNKEHCALFVLTWSDDVKII